MMQDHSGASSAGTLGSTIPTAATWDGDAGAGAGVGAARDTGAPLSAGVVELGVAEDGVAEEGPGLGAAAGAKNLDALSEMATSGGGGGTEEGGGDLGAPALVVEVAPPSGVTGAREALVWVGGPAAALGPLRAAADLNKAEAMPRAGAEATAPS